MVVNDPAVAAERNRSDPAVNAVVLNPRSTPNDVQYPNADGLMSWVAMAMTTEVEDAFDCARVAVGTTPAMAELMQTTLTFVIVATVLLNART